MFFLLTPNVKSQTGNLQVQGLYVDSFDLILGNCQKEDSLLNFARDNGYNYLALYALHKIPLLVPATGDMLRAFNKKAKINCGIDYIGAVGESYGFFNNLIKPYNSACSDDKEKFDVFNLEFEYWSANAYLPPPQLPPNGYICTTYLSPNGYTCDRTGAYQYYILTLDSIDSLAHTLGAISETYLGWFDPPETNLIKQNVDRILLHAYCKNPSLLFNYAKLRLEDLGSYTNTTNVIMLFSAEDTSAQDSFLGHWLNTHPPENAFDSFIVDYNTDTSSWKQQINLMGYQWFDWYFLKHRLVHFNLVAAPTITYTGDSSICFGDTINFISSPATSYEWFTGEFTDSIKLHSAGRYEVYVSTGYGICKLNSDTIIFTISPIISPPTISPGNISICSGDSVTLSSSYLYNNLWKSLTDTAYKDTTSTITISSPGGSYLVRTYSGPNCYFESNPVTINFFLPTQHTITKEVLPPDTLFTQQLRYNLVSSYQNNNSWNTGDTIPNIVVNTHGIFSDTITDLNGCISKDSITIDACQTLLTQPVVSPAGLVNVNPGDMVSLTAVTTAQYYYWMPSLETTPGINVTINQDSTFYLVEYNDSFCYSYSPPITIVTQIVDINYKSFTSLYPNPAEDFIKLQFSTMKSDKYIIRIYDVLNREIFLQKGNSYPGENVVVMNTSTFKRGLYFVSVSVDDRNKILKLDLE